MPTPKPPGNVFLHRAPGEEAIPISRGSARLDEAVRAVLHAADGRVLVKNIQRGADGTFSGVVYGVMPGQTSVGLGAAVQFEASQIFRFRASEIPEYDVPDGEMEEMARSFDAGWNDSTPGPVRNPPLREASSADPAFDIRLPEDPVAPAAAEAPRAAREPKPAPRAAEAEPPISLGEAYSILGARAPAAGDRRDAPIEPRAEVPPRPAEALKSRVAEKKIEPRAAEARPRVTGETGPRAAGDIEAPVARTVPTPIAREEPGADAQTPAPAEQRITCVECGASVIVPPVPPLPPGAEAPAKRRVSCRQCGRINDVRP